MSDVIVSDNICNPSPGVQEPTEEDALRLLDEAKDALSEIRDMKGLEALMSAGSDEDLPRDDNVTDCEKKINNEEDEQTKSEVELEQLSIMVEASIPKEQPDEKPLSRLSIADKKVPVIQGMPVGPPPAPAPHMDVTPGYVNSSNSGTSANSQETRRRWAAIRKLFGRNKAAHKF